MCGGADRVFDMATIITVANQKGGPGKTTAAINVACQLIDSKYGVEVIDLDPQATFTRWNKTRDRLGLKPLKVQSVPQGLLNDELVRLRNDTTIELVIVDCPGNIQDITTRAVALSNAVLCPVRATWADFNAMKAMAQFVDETRFSHPEIHFMIFHNLKHASRTIDKEAHDSLVKQFRSSPDTKILDTAIPDAAELAEFGGRGQSVFEYAPRSAAARQFKKLTREVVECLAKNQANATN